MKRSELENWGCSLALIAVTLCAACAVCVRIIRWGMS